MFKFKSKRSKKLNEISFLMDCMLEDVDDILEDIDDLILHQQENNKLIATIQKQCEQIILKMEKKDDRTLEEIVDNIEKLVGKDNAKE